MEYEVKGTTMQTLVISLNRGESVFSETGCLLMMSDGVRMNTTAGGLGGMIARRFTGNSLFLNTFEAESHGQEVMFATRMPGHIVPFDMRRHTEIIVQRHSFLCAEENVEYKSAFTVKFGRLFGGNGLMFNYIRGNGFAFVSVDGEVVERELARGETIYVHPGHVAAFSAEVDYRVELMKGVKNMLFGGDGLYLIRLTGPGHVWMHGLSVHNLAEILMAPGNS